MRIDVVNIKASGKPDPRQRPWEVYIGRPCYGLKGSPLANPYTVAQWGRDRAVDMYAWDLRSALEGVPDVNGRGGLDLAAMKAAMNALFTVLHQHGRITLFCWCAPAQCHGDVIAKALLGMKCPTCGGEDHPHGGPDCPTCGRG